MRGEGTSNAEIIAKRIKQEKFEGQEELSEAELDRIREIREEMEAMEPSEFCSKNAKRSS